MKARERILRSIRCLEVDRRPVSPFIWVNFVNWFFSSGYRLSDEALDERLFYIYRYFAFDPIVRTCGSFSANAQLSADGWRMAQERIDQGPTDSLEKLSIETPSRLLTQSRRVKRVTPYDELSAETEPLIKSPDDLKYFMKYQPEIDQPDFSRIGRCKEMLGEEGVTAPWLQGVFNVCARLAGLENMMLWAYEEPEAYHALMEYNAKRTALRGAQMARAGADIISYEGNMATATLVGPAFFRDLVSPYEKRAIAEIRASGAHVLYHNCGDTNTLLSEYNSLGISALESLTPPPFGDCDIAYAREVVARDIAISGNIDQIQFLLRATPSEVGEAARALLELWRGRPGFILATSDYLMEGTPEENLKALSEAAVRYG